VVTGPLPTMQVEARYLVHGARRLVVIEAAQAHGLVLLESHRLAPLEATSYGVGELLRHVLHTEQPAQVVLALGGSASTDAGLGALQALGVRCFDAAGVPLEAPLGGGDLRSVARVEWPAAWRE